MLNINAEDITGKIKCDPQTFTYYIVCGDVEYSVRTAKIVAQINGSGDQDLDGRIIFLLKDLQDCVDSPADPLYSSIREIRREKRMTWSEAVYTAMRRVAYVIADLDERPSVARGSEDLIMLMHLREKSWFTRLVSMVDPHTKALVKEAKKPPVVPHPVAEIEKSDKKPHKKNKHRKSKS